MHNTPANETGNRESLTETELADVYARLRRIASRLMERERIDHTLAPTEVVHEALARLLPEDGKLPQASNELLGHAAHVMRQVLVDHARKRGAVKRGGGMKRAQLADFADAEILLGADDFDWDALEDALQFLAQHDPRRHSVVNLRFFAGLNNRQIAQYLGIDERTVNRDWSAARLWLKQRLTSP